MDCNDINSHYALQTVSWRNHDAPRPPTRAPAVRTDHNRLLRSLCRWAAAGTGVLIVLHDLNLAVRFADRLLLLAAGRQVAYGAPGQVSRRSGASANPTWRRHPASSAPEVTYLGHPELETFEQVV